MFVAPEGYCFGYFDLEQAEARYVGWDAGITTWIEQFERARVDGSYDCHRALASEMFGVPYEDVPKFDFTDHSAGKFVDGLGDNEPTIRFIAKRCRHGLNYRMAPMKLAETTHMTLQQATQAYHTYHRLTPELRAWWDALTAEVKRTQMLFSSYGRRLVIIERITEEALESIVAFKPQSTIGDKVNRVIYMSEEDDRWPADARIVLNIHDSLICLAPHAKIKTCLSIMKEHAEEPLMVNGMQLIIPASCKISTPIAWEAANDDSHAIKYIPREDGLHRWYGMKSVQL
jgi:DNA polymerase I-like protein with 3'-5' exonuclease and polymerase domains